MLCQVGFNSGIGDKYYVIPESGTGTTADLHTLTGKTRDIGRWLFRVNTDTINGRDSEEPVACMYLLYIYIVIAHYYSSIFIVWFLR